MPMAKVKVLVKGYAREEGDTELASSTATLIQENGINIIVDPGMDRKRLLEALEKEGLPVKDINYVILTHTHPDHCLLAGIFENAKVMDSSEIFSFNGKIESHKGKVPGTGIELINTPGHDTDEFSVVVDTEDGKVVIASDVFWWPDSKEQKTDRESLMNHEDPYMKNKEELAQSREKILEIADYIIPGHGKMFKVEK